MGITRISHFALFQYSKIMKLKRKYGQDMIEAKIRLELIKTGFDLEKPLSLSISRRRDTMLYNQNPDVIAEFNAREKLNPSQPGKKRHVIEFVRRKG